MILGEEQTNVYRLLIKTKIDHKSAAKKVITSEMNKWKVNSSIYFYRYNCTGYYVVIRGMFFGTFFTLAIGKEFRSIPFHPFIHKKENINDITISADQMNTNERSLGEMFFYQRIKMSMYLAENG